MKKFKKITYYLSIIFFLSLTITPTVFAISTTSEAVKEFGQRAYGTDAEPLTPMEIAINILSVVLTLLGVIAIIMIVYGGFKWMTSAGSDEKIKEAKKLITAAIIGLLIILMAYAITQFVINSFYSATIGEGTFAPLNN